MWHEEVILNFYTSQIALRVDVKQIRRLSHVVEKASAFCNTYHTPHTIHLYEWRLLNAQEESKSLVNPIKASVITTIPCLKIRNSNPTLSWKIVTDCHVVRIKARLKHPRLPYTINLYIFIGERLVLSAWRISNLKMFAICLDSLRPFWYPRTSV